jgi:hypothetical protein
LGAQDTLRTNLWVAQALMVEVVRQTVRSLPPAPAKVIIQPQSTGAPTDVFGTVVAEVLGEAGYELYLDQTEENEEAEGTGRIEQTEADSTAVATEVQVPVGVDYEYRFKIEQIRLSYPQVKRRFGIWRQWVDRELTLGALVTIVHKPSGRLLMNDRFERTFQDRVASDDFDSVRSEVYDFTDTELQAGGWHRRAEQIVVLGTLAGLIAVYFANTGN